MDQTSADVDSYPDAVPYRVLEIARTVESVRKQSDE
jgi:hypothetical protein